MKSGSKLTTSDAYDRVISAEIPDKDKYPEWHDLVASHMLHGPCGVLNKNYACMVDGECRFQYPRQFCEATQQGRTPIQPTGEGMMDVESGLGE
jgi:hypothetical protein